MDDETRKFLSALVSAGGTATAMSIKVVCSREQDRARQRARLAGLVEFRKRGFRGMPSHWAITEAGRAALDAQ